MSGNIACDKCGACCRTFPVFASAEDAEREPQIKREACQVADWEVSEERKYQMHPLPFRNACCFLGENNLCSIYKTRPGVCRKFEAGSEQCNEARQRAGLDKIL